MKKHPVYIISFLTILGIICALLLSLVNLFTAPYIELNSKKELKDKLEQYGVTLDKIIDEDKNIEKVKASYEGSLEDKKKCYVFEVEANHSFVDKPFSVFVVLGKENGTIVTFFTQGDIASGGYDANFKDNFLGVIGSNEKNFDSSFKPVSGASYTSNAFKDAFKIAFDQYQEMVGEQDD